MKKYKVLQVLAFIMVLSIFVTLQTNIGLAISHLEFNDGTGNYYNYCPSYIQTSSTERYMFYCKNRDSGVITDYIYYRRATFNGSSWVWGSQSIALSPGSSGWDRVHVCDPDVKQGRFTWNGHTYNYVMFYLGCDQTDCNHNQIGIAFADSLNGPWVKYSGNPVIAYSGTTTWGVGQASATCVDGVGRMLLFYTKGGHPTDPSLTYICRRDINIANMSSPSWGTEVRVFTNGLSDKTANFFCFHNAAFAYDGTTDRFYVVRDRCREEGILPDFVSSEVQVAYTSSSNIWNNTGTWTEEGCITPDQTGNTRNHNATLLTDVWGNLIGGANGYTISYASSNTGDIWLWQYRIYSAQKSDLTKINKIDGQNKGVIYSGTWNDYFDSNLLTWYMGTDKYTSSPGAYFQCAFNGTNIYYYGSKASDNGKADIYIDNVFQATIDTYSAIFNKSVLLWSKTGLTSGNHTIKVVVRGDKNPLSTGYNKDLDYLKIMPDQVNNTLIIDNDPGAPDFTLNGAWSATSSGGYNNGSYRYATAGTAKSATWAPNLPTAGTWRVSVIYKAGTNRATSAKFNVATASSTQTVYVNQTLNNLTWVTLGTWSMSAGGGNITLDAAGSSGGTSPQVIADAVKYEYVSP